MQTSIFRSLAYVYIALALAPLVLITIALGVALWRGGDVLLWNMLSAGPRAPAAAEQAKDERITFRTELLALSSDRFNPSAANHYALGVGQVSSGAANNAAFATSLRMGTQAGRFNNVLILDKQTGRVSKVFDRRMSVTLFSGIDLPSGKALVVFAAGDDTNKDGVLDAKDLHGVFVYTLGDAKLHTVTGLDGSAAALEDATDPGSIVVRAVIDANKDGSAVLRSPYEPPGEDEEEPQAFYKVDLATFAAAPLVPAPMVDELQSALGARRPQDAR